MTAITVNGEPRHTSASQSVADLMEGILGVRIGVDGTVPGGTTLGIAVAVNSVVVPRASAALSPSVRPSRLKI